MYDFHGTECHFVHRRILGGVAGFFSGGPAGAVAGFAGGGGAGGCGGGTVRNPRTGNCERVSGFNVTDRGLGFGGGGGGRDRPGALGAIQRALPLGATGTFEAGAAVMGQWGAALEPAVVGSVERRDGSTGPLLRCLRGMVLGTDDLCYNKPLANTKRKWPRPTPAFLTGGQVKCLRTADRIRKSKASKKLLRGLGF